MTFDEDVEIHEIVDDLPMASPAYHSIEDMDDMLKEFFATHPYDLACYLNNKLDRGWPEFAKEDMACFVSYGEPVFKSIKYADVGWITYKQFIAYLE